jgi:hypothetical protein
LAFLALNPLDGGDPDRRTADSNCLASRLPLPNTRSAAVLVNELDAGHFQGTPNRQVIGSNHGSLAVG